MDPIELDDGWLVYTGCQVPDERPTTMLSYGDVGPMLTRDQVLEIITSPTYRGGRKRFGPELIKQQENNSCNGQAGAGALERCRVEKGLPYVKLSGTGLYAQVSGGRDQGSMLDDGMHAMMSNGVPPYELCSDEYLYRQDDMSQEAKQACGRFRAHECHRIDDEDMLLSALASDFFCVVAVHVGRNFQVTQNGVINPSDGPGNHAVLLDGLVYDAGRFYEDMANSWGVREWGVGGRGLTNWDMHFRTTSRYHAFYAIRGALDDPENPLPPIAA